MLTETKQGGIGGIMDKIKEPGLYLGNEVPPLARRPRHSAAERLRILAELDGCVRRGEASALARREGVYLCTLNHWKTWRERMRADNPERRGNAEESYEQLRNRLRRAERENRRLALQLRRAEEIIVFQKKLSVLLKRRPGDENSCGSD